MKIWFLVVLAACGDSKPTPDVPPDARDELASFGSAVGPDNQAGFSLELQDPSLPMAMGASASMLTETRSTAPIVVTATTASPAILTAGAIVRSANDDPRYSTIPLTAHAEGETDLILLDANGGEIDRWTVHVVPTDTLRSDADLGTPLVFPGGPVVWHLTTFTAGQGTIGTGAVSFTLTGVEAGSLDEVDDFGGDEVLFHGATGSVDATAPYTAAAHLDVVAVDPAALTQISPSAVVIDGTGGTGLFSDTSVAITVKANGVPVYGANCTWSNLKGLSVGTPQFGGLGGDSAFEYTFDGPPATYMPICTVGPLSTQLVVHIHS
ncbi:MAG: pilus assembly protein N-terminal domain-containing protein [Kofleriaceae bacterium]